MSQLLGVLNVLGFPHLLCPHPPQAAWGPWNSKAPPTLVYKLGDPLCPFSLPSPHLGMLGALGVLGSLLPLFSASGCQGSKASPLTHLRVLAISKAPTSGSRQSQGSPSPDSLSSRLLGFPSPNSAPLCSPHSGGPKVPLLWLF